VIVETDKLTKRYREVTALDECTVGVEQGEVFGLLGPNGAGKTTLLRLLLGYIRPSEGVARIAGLDCHKQSKAVRRLTTYLPGDARLFRHMRGKEVLQFFAAMRPRGDLAYAMRLADRLELDLKRRVAFMSTGMRQKLALAATLACEAPLVILDEPTANLDPTVRGQVLQMVAEARQGGRTVIFSSHVLSEVEEVCDRVMILRRGKLVHVQVMAELRRRHRIHLQLREALPPPPEELREQMEIHQGADGKATIDTLSEISQLFGWLSELPLITANVEPIGLRAIYDRYHRGSSTEHVST
jgi:ABC-2 type transport system ATP-binding protein